MNRMMSNKEDNTSDPKATTARSKNTAPATNQPASIFFSATAWYVSVHLISLIYATSISLQVQFHKIELVVSSTFL